jgi:hypothetical protein
MYGRKVTNINRHKGFAPENPRNKQKVEDAEAEHLEKQKEIKQKTVVLQKERVAEKYEALADGEASSKRKTEWMYQDTKTFEATANEGQVTMTGEVRQDDASPTAAEKVGEKRKRTGAISDEEAAQLKKEIEDKRKASRDPLTALRQAEQRQLAAAARHGPQAPAAGASFDKSKALQLLRAAQALKKK